MRKREGKEEVQLFPRYKIRSAVFNWESRLPIYDEAALVDRTHETKLSALNTCNLQDQLVEFGLRKKLVELKTLQIAL